MNDDLPDLQCEVAYILGELVPKSSENTKTKLGIQNYARIFVNLLTHSDDSVRGQAVLAFGRVVRDIPSCHDLLREIDALGHVVAQVNEHADLSILRAASMSLFILCRENFLPPMEQIMPAFQQLVRSNDVEVLAKACRALSLLTGGTDKKIQAVIDADICRHLVELLKHRSYRVYIPALQTVGNITTGDDCQTQAVIECGALPHLRSLLTSKYQAKVHSLACFAISNISAGNKEQIESVIKAELISPLVTLLQTAEDNVKEDAASAILKITSKGTREQIKYLVSQGCIKPLCNLLSCPTSSIVTVCLDALENILKVGDS